MAAAVGPSYRGVTARVVRGVGLWKCHKMLVLYSVVTIMDIHLIGSARFPPASGCQEARADHTFLVCGDVKEIVVKT